MPSQYDAWKTEIPDYYEDDEDELDAVEIRELKADMARDDIPEE